MSNPNASSRPAHSSAVGGGCCLVLVLTSLAAVGLKIHLATLPPSETQAVSKPRISVQAAIDNTRSCQSLRALFASAVASVATKLDPAHDQLHLSRFDQAHIRMPSIPPPWTTAAVQSFIWPHLHCQGCAAQVDPSRFWATLALRAEADPGTTIALFVTDGEDNSPSGTQPDLQIAAEALAANPRVALVAVVGLNPDKVASTYDIFKDLQNRLLVSPVGDPFLCDQLSRHLDQIASRREPLTIPATTSRHL